MLEHWNETTLEDLVEIKHGFAFKGQHINDESNGDVLLTPGNFAVGGGFKQDRLKYYDGSVLQEYVLCAGDLIITMTDLSKQSDTLGFPALVPTTNDGKRFLHNQRLGKISIVDETTVDPKYLYYVLCTEAYRHEVLASATGTTVKHTSPNRIKQFRLMLPPLPEQRAIAHILGTLDDKIELNRKMNQTLEEIARALFKSWFVDFDPVRAKLDGRWRPGESLPGLPADLHHLFPDRLVPSQLGEIPEGWEVRTLAEFASLNPDVWSRKIHPDQVKYVDLANTKWGVIESTQEIAWAAAPSRARRILKDGDTVVGTVRPGNGSYALIGYDGLTGSTGFAVLAPHKPAYRELVYLCATDGENIERLTHLADGAAYPAVRPDVVGATAVAAPEPAREIYQRFSEAVGPVLDRMGHNHQQTRLLAAQRDALLPKLVSGIVAVNVEIS